MIPTRWVSLRPTTLTKDGTDQFILDSTGHHMTTLPTNIQVLLFDYGNQLRDNRLLGPRSAVLPELGPGIEDARAGMGIGMGEVLP